MPKDTVKSKKAKAEGRATYNAAKVKGDPDFTKLRKLQAELKDVNDQIRRQSGSKGKIEASKLKSKGSSKVSIGRRKAMNVGKSTFSVAKAKGGPLITKRTKLQAAIKKLKNRIKSKYKSAGKAAAVKT